MYFSVYTCRLPYIVGIPLFTLWKYTLTMYINLLLFIWGYTCLAVYASECTPFNPLKNRRVKYRNDCYFAGW